MRPLTSLGSHDCQLVGLTVTQTFKLRLRADSNVFPHSYYLSHIHSLIHSFSYKFIRSFIRKNVQSHILNQRGAHISHNLALLQYGIAQLGAPIWSKEALFHTHHMVLPTIVSGFKPGHTFNCRADLRISRHPSYPQTLAKVS